MYLGIGIFLTKLSESARKEGGLNSLLVLIVSLWSNIAESLIKSY